MNCATYKENQRQFQLDAPVYRQRCPTCLQPEFACYCKWVEKIDLNIDFVILIHPKEVKRRRITTGRMAHLCLQNSFLFMGHLFDDDARVDAILSDPSRHCVLLYPSQRSANLTTMSPAGLRSFVPPGKRLTVFVIDGTWSTAKKTVNQSANLKRLPQFTFAASRPSKFRVRLQPRAECLSTIEAIHQAVELLGPAVGLDPAERIQDQLLAVFSKMVARELQLAGARLASRAKTF